MHCIYLNLSRALFDKKNMAAALESVPENEPIKDGSKWIEVYETNYKFHKKLPVHGQMEVGQLIFLMVKEMGKY